MVSTPHPRKYLFTFRTSLRLSLGICSQGLHDVPSVPSADAGALVLDPRGSGQIYPAKHQYSSPEQQGVIIPPTFKRMMTVYGINWSGTCHITRHRTQPLQHPVCIIGLTCHMFYFRTPSLLPLLSLHLSGGTGKVNAYSRVKPLVSKITDQSDQKLHVCKITKLGIALRPLLS